MRKLYFIAVALVALAIACNSGAKAKDDPKPKDKVHCPWGPDRPCLVVPRY